VKEITKIDFANEIRKDINKVIGKLNKLKSYGMRQTDKKHLEISKNYL